MDRSVVDYLIKNNINPRDYVIVRKTCDSMVLKNKNNNKRLDVRW